MSHELWNTSVPQGLRPGSSGFCTVVVTAGLPRTVEDQLMLLSGYRWLFPAGHPDAARNPVSWAHWKISSGGKPLHVLSRVCDAGVDYSQRSNRFAFHLVLNPSEVPPAGPAWTIQQPGVAETAFTGDPRTLPAGRPVPPADMPARPCPRWQQVTGDAGWAGVLAEAFMTDPTRPAYLIYQPGQDVLPLIEEALALLPPADRWRVTFNTYFTDLPAGMSCIWRCCVAGTPAAKEATRLATSGVILDITQPLGAAPQTAWTAAARTGGVVQMAQAAAVPARAAPNDLPVNGDEGELTLKPRRYLVEPKPVGESTDQTEENDWMPPLSATVVETPAMEVPQAETVQPLVKRSRWLAFSIQILWPIVAVAAVVTWHFASEPSSKGPPQSASIPADSAKTATTPITSNANTSVSTVNPNSETPNEGNSIGDVNSATTMATVTAARVAASALPKLVVTTQPIIATTTPSDEPDLLGEQKKAIANLQRRIGDAETRNTNLQSQFERAVKDREDANRLLNELRPETFVAKMMDNEWELANKKQLRQRAVTLALKPPETKDPQIQVIDEEGGISIEYRNALPPSGDAKASVPKIRLMTFRIDDGNVVAGQPNRNLEEWQRGADKLWWLYVSPLEIKGEDGKAFSRVRFSSVKQQPIYLWGKNPGFSIKYVKTKEALSGLVLRRGGSAPNKWKIEEGDGGRTVKVTSEVTPAASFDINFKTDSNLLVLESNFSLKLDACSNAIDKHNKAAAEARDDAQEIQKLRQIKKRSDAENKRLEELSESNPKRREHDAEAEVARWEQVQKALNGIPQFQLAVVFAATGLEMCQLNVSLKK